MQRHTIRTESEPSLKRIVEVRSAAILPFEALRALFLIYNSPGVYSAQLSKHSVEVRENLIILETLQLINTKSNRLFISSLGQEYLDRWDEQVDLQVIENLGIALA